MSNSTFTLAVLVIMTLGVAIAVALAVLSPGSVPVVPAPRQTMPAPLGDIRNHTTPVNLDEIPEASVRALYDDLGYFFGPDQRLAQIAKKYEGGFGGYSFHRTDKSHAYVYMMDVSKTEAAEAAFREAYGAGTRTITKITIVQGQFPFDRLVAWFPVVDRALLANGISPTSGSRREICNRLIFGVEDKSLVSDARRIVGDLGIPQEAVVFKVGRPRLLALEDGKEPILRPVVDWVKRQFRSRGDEERPDPYGPGRC